ncbi:MAG TPA: hypothetical protein VK034_26335, partial [Enhygromyxa sp.]|nr:hypothetical protein [Enhygromyxa sp.]
MSADWREALFARRALGVRLGTASLAAVLDRLRPGMREQPPFFVTQIVGTNGKSSTAAMLEHGLRALGHGPVGLYTSPHLVRVGERIRIDGAAVTDEEMRAGAVRVGEAEAGDSLTYFETLTAIALDRFVAAGCRHVVLESGLGGRTDATSVIARHQVLISRIGLDHERFLGEGIAAITRDKAAVIAPKVPVASVIQRDDAREIIESAARERQAPLTFVEPLERPPVGLLGDHQRHNGALALAGLRQVSPHAGPEALDGVRWSGRLERRSVASGELWLDVAHNQDGVEALRAAVIELGIEPSVIVFGTLADKPAETMAAVLRELAPLWLVPPVADQAFASEAVALPGELRFAATVDPALLQGLRDRLEAGERILVCGSHYLVGVLGRALVDGDFSASDLGDP